MIQGNAIEISTYFHIMCDDNGNDCAAYDRKVAKQL